jgi:hypothetical protein
VMAWALLCPATNPTARSLDPVEATVPEDAVVLVAAAPIEPSNGLVVATPANSWTCRATVVAPVVTVTLLTEAAFGAYHISPSEFWPATEYAPILVHVFLPSVTAVIGLLAPVNTPEVSTRRSPAWLGAERVTVVVADPALWTKTGPAGLAGVLTFTAAVCCETLPAPSRASTLYW